ncbi:MAG: 50S ribosomal protein L18, partial [Spirochaetales bacterium]
MKRLRIKQEQKKRRKSRVRRKINGSADRPRISVYKSNKYLYVQVIDDSTGHTLAQTSGVSGNTRGLKATVEHGKQIGEDVGGKMKSLGLDRAVY